jgi:hypothetical protein
MPEDCISADTGDKNSKPDLLPRHIAGHLKRLALLSLPPRGDVGGLNDSTIHSEDSGEESGNDQSLPESQNTNPEFSIPPQAGDLVEDASLSKLIAESLGSVPDDPLELRGDDEWTFATPKDLSDYVGHADDPVLKPFRGRAQSAANTQKESPVETANTARNKRSMKLLISVDFGKLNHTTHPSL